MHDDKYDYTLIRSEHIQIRDSKVPVICKQCMFQWSSEAEIKQLGMMGIAVERIKNKYMHIYFSLQLHWQAMHSETLLVG